MGAEEQPQANGATSLLGRPAMYGVLGVLLQLSLGSLNSAAVYRLR
jgi:hypothetical protein